ncbi:HdeD family acid-resistance protein [soil metagenome]
MTTTPVTDPLASLAKGIWWMVLLRGIFAILFGVIALFLPGAALIGVTVVFAVYAIADGAVAISHAVRRRSSLPGWGWLLFQGIVGVLAGLVALIFPGLAGTVGALFLLWIITFFAIFYGAGAIASATRTPRTPRRPGRVWTIVGGVVAIVFGVLFSILIWVTPVESVLSLIWVAGVYAIIFGVTLIIAAIQLRRGVKSILEELRDDTATS